MTRPGLGAGTPDRRLSRSSGGEAHHSVAGMTTVIMVVASTWPPFARLTGTGALGSIAPALTPHRSESTRARRLNLTTPDSLELSCGTGAPPGTWSSKAPSEGTTPSTWAVTTEVGEVVGLSCRLSGVSSKETPLGGGGTATVTVAESVAELPARSVAIAVTARDPVDPEKSKDAERGEEVDIATSAPSTRSARETRSAPAASAERRTAPETLAPSAGERRVTTGGVVSRTTLTVTEVELPEASVAVKTIALESSRRRGMTPLAAPPPGAKDAERPPGEETTLTALASETRTDAAMLVVLTRAPSTGERTITTGGTLSTATSILKTRTSPVPVKASGLPPGTPKAASDRPSPLTSPSPATEKPSVWPKSVPVAEKREEPSAPEKIVAWPALPSGPASRKGAPTTISLLPSPFMSPARATDWPAEPFESVPGKTKRRDPPAPEKALADPASRIAPTSAKGDPTRRSGTESPSTSCPPPTELPKASPGAAPERERRTAPREPEKART